MSKNEPELTNLLNNSHQLVINNMTNVNFKTTRVAIPGFSFTPTEVDFPNQQYSIPGMKFRADPLIITFIVDELMTNYFECLRWLAKCRYYDEHDMQTEVLQDFTVNLLDNHDRPSVSIRFSRGFLQALESPVLESTIDKPTQVTSTLTLRYQNIQIDQYRGGNKETILDLTL